MSLRILWKDCYLFFLKVKYFISLPVLLVIQQLSYISANIDNSVMYDLTTNL